MKSREAIRQTCGDDFVIGLKMPGDEGVAGGIDPDEAARITAALARPGLLDYFAYSQGNFTLSLENHAPDMHFRRGHFLDIHKKMRLASAGVPVMAIGRIATPAEAEAAIADGAGDLVGMTRALIADADWPAKARERRRRGHQAFELRQFCLGRDSCRQAAGGTAQPAARPQGQIRLAAGWCIHTPPRRRRGRGSRRAPGGPRRGGARP